MAIARDTKHHDTHEQHDAQVIAARSIQQTPLARAKQMLATAAVLQGGIGGLHEDTEGYLTGVAAGDSRDAITRKVDIDPTARTQPGIQQVDLTPDSPAGFQTASTGPGATTKDELKIDLSSLSFSHPIVIHMRNPATRVAEDIQPIAQAYWVAPSAPATNYAVANSTELGSSAETAVMLTPIPVAVAHIEKDALEFMAARGHDPRRSKYELLPDRGRTTFTA